MQGQVGTQCGCVCVFGGLIGTLACWTAGVWSRCHRCCLALLIKRKENSFYVHTHSHIHSHTHLQSSLSQREPLLLFMSTLIRVSGKRSWTALRVCLASFFFLLWPLTHAQTCPLSLSLCLFASPHQRLSLFFTATLLFTQYLRPQCWFSVCVGAVGQYN